MAKQDDYARYTIRIPKDVYARLEKSAHEANRSINAEIIARLEYTVGMDDHIQAHEGAPLPDLGQYGLDLKDHLKMNPRPGSNIEKSIQDIFEQLRDINLKVAAVRVLGNDEREYVVTTQPNRDNKEDAPPPFPAPTEQDFLEVLQKEAASMGYDLVKKKG